MTSRRFASPSGSAAAESAFVSAGADVADFVPEFPGCRPVRITRDAIADHESRIEYWDAATEEDVLALGDDACSWRGRKVCLPAEEEYEHSEPVAAVGGAE